MSISITFHHSISTYGIKNQYELSKDDLQSKGKNFSEESVKRKRKKEVELYVPKGYTFEELYDGDDTGYGFEEESPALQEEVKIRYERNDGKERV